MIMNKLNRQLNMGLPCHTYVISLTKSHPQDPWLRGTIFSCSEPAHPSIEPAQAICSELKEDIVIIGQATQAVCLPRGINNADMESAHRPMRQHHDPDFRS